MSMNMVALTVFTWYDKMCEHACGANARFLCGNLDLKANTLSEFQMESNTYVTQICGV